MFRRSHNLFFIKSTRPNLALFCQTRSNFCESSNTNDTRRFTTPWSDSGIDPTNIHTSSNPIIRKKRDESRLKEHVEQFEADVAHEEHVTRDKEIRAESERQMRERLTNFKPLGGGAGADKTAAAFPHQDHLRLQGDDETIAKISSGIFTHLEEYRKSARPHNPHVDVDLENFLPLPQTIEEIIEKSENFSKFPYGGKVGFALDMDGVLIRGSPAVGVKVIEGVKEAITFFQKAKIPFVIMTNGGGNLESVLARNLSKRIQLDTPITEDQVMVSTSPMKALVDPKNREWIEQQGRTWLADKPILVLGPYESACKVLKSYGFQNPIHIRDFQAQFPQFTPLKTFPESIQETVDRSLKRHPNDDPPIPQFAAVFALSLKGIDAFHDYQVLQDVLLGVPAGQAGGGIVAETQQIPFYFASEDLFWPSAPKIPRVGFGAIKEMFSSVFETVTGEPLDFISYGKPRRIAYLNAQKMLKEQNKKLGWGDDKIPELICMIGDNIHTDITGANAMNCVGSGGGEQNNSTKSKWMSVHVMTGVGRVPPASKTIPPTDKELEWLSTHFVDCAPHYVAPTFRHFVGEICHFDEKQMTQMVTETHMLPNPVDVEELYHWREEK